MAMLVSEEKGTIEPSVLYTLEELKRRTGWAAGSFRSARRNGLRVKYAGRHAFILGADFINFISEAGRDTK